MNLINKSRKAKRGAALVEYGLIVAGVALVAAAAISVFGHKTAGMIAASAVILPGTNAADNGPIGAGHVVAVDNSQGFLAITPGVNNNLGDNLGTDTSTLVIDPANNP